MIKLRTVGSNLNTSANSVMPEQLNRVRELAYTTFSFTTSVLITAQLDEIPSGAGPQFVATTYTNTFAPSLPSGVPSKREGKDVTIMGRPVELNALESFTVPVYVPQGAFSPTAEIWVTCVFNLKGANKS